MKEIIVSFINELRSQGLRISLAESMDALQAVATVGVERELLREALATSLVKEEEDRPLFDEIFARLFAGPGSRRRGRKTEKHGEGDGQKTKPTEVGAGRDHPTKPQRVSARPTQEREERRPLSDKEKQEKSKAAKEQETIQEAGGEGEERDQKARPALSLAEGPVLSVAEALAKALARRRALWQKPFKAFDSRDIEEAKELVEQLARRFRGRLSRRYKRSRRGRLDFRRTIRASISRGGVPIEVHTHGRQPGKPDLAALCDVSGSVAVVSDFLLGLLAPAESYFRHVQTFAYVNHLCEVSFEHGHMAPHGSLDLYAFSDFGRVLQDFWHQYGDRALTRNTIFLILGDARNNRRPPRPDLLARIKSSSKKLFWLNPEPRERWDTGDSVIGRYTPICDGVFECGNLQQLLAALKRTL
jgi:uncharacterized protein with von Willebrand factor type A (vWA) domain